MPRVSVVVANYNNARYLNKCLDSLLAQSYTDYEVLVFDDASTDNSKEIIRNYSLLDKRFKLIELPENKGVAYLRSLCLTFCLGEYIAILDADDYSYPARLLYQVSYLDQHPDVVIVGGYYSVIDAHGIVKRKKKTIPTTDLELRWRLSVGNIFIHSTVMFRKEAAIIVGGYDPDIDCSEDMDIYCRLMTLGRLAAIPELLSCWRTHTTSYSNKAFERILLGTYTILVRNAKVLINRHISLTEAEALFNHSKTYAQSASDFLSALDIISSYKDLYWKQCRTKAEKKSLLRCHIQTLLSLRKRNLNRLWYPEVQENLNRSIKAVLFQDKYCWLLDPELKISARNWLHLWSYTLGIKKRGY